MIRTFEILKDTLLKLIFRNGTENQRVNVVLDVGEPAYTIDSKRLYIGDGVTKGGTLAGNLFNGVRPLVTVNSGTPVIGDLAYSTDHMMLYVYKGGLPTDINNWEPIANGNTVELNFLPLSGGIVNGSISATENITVSGNISTSNNISAVENIVAKNIIAQDVVSALGGSSILWNESYSTLTGLSALWNIGYSAATAISSLSSSWIGAVNTINSNIDEWNNAVTTTRSLSEGVINTVNTLSANWNNAYTTAGELSVACSVSGNWNSTYDTVSALSAVWGTLGQESWDSTYGTVCALSAIWGTEGQESWDSTYTSVNSLSSDWSSTYDTTYALSAKWLTSYSSVSSLSAKWMTAYTVLTNYYIPWQSNYITVSSLSAGWSNAYTYVTFLTATSLFNTVSSLSGRWISVYNTVNSLSGNWNNIVYDINRLNAAYSSASALSGGTVSVFNTVSSLSSSWSIGQIIQNNSDNTIILKLSDAYKYIRLTKVGPVTITVPTTEPSQNFPIGAEIIFRKTPSVTTINIIHSPTLVVVNDKELISTVQPGRIFRLKYLGITNDIYYWDLIV